MAVMSAFGTKRTSAVALHMSAFGGKADNAYSGCNYRCSPTASARWGCSDGGGSGSKPPDQCWYRAGKPSGDYRS